MTGPAVQNRKTVRKAIAQMLQSGLVGQVAVIYAYQRKLFDKQSPVIVVHSGAADRVVEATDMLTSDSLLHFHIHIFVRYQDLDTTPQWTEEASEDQIDDLEAKVMDLILANGSNYEGELGFPWYSLYTIGASDITRAIFEGIDYRHEEIYIAATVSNIA
jgi:hypothetical protein